ncbi:MAG: hypothetical protein AAF518_27060 [Spirochaetota bacterium]
MKFLLFCFMFILAHCQQNQKENSDNQTITLGNLFVEASLAATANVCAVDSASNMSHFTTDTVPSGYSVSVRRVYTTLSDGNRSEVYYPNDTRANLPVLIVFPGGNVHGSFYSRLAAGLASSGYVVYIPYRCSVFFFQYFLVPSIDLPSIVFSDANAQNSNSGDLQNRIDTSSLGLIGHSLGGVIGLFSMNGICEFPFCDSAPNSLTQVKAGVFYGSGLGTSYSSDRYKTTNGVGIPVAYVQGSLDSAFTPTDAEENFANVPSPSYLYTVEGANHYGITDSNNPVVANPETNDSTLAQDSAILAISNLTVLFMDAYLKNDATSLSSIQSGSTGIANVTLASSK